jgi:hypothetical protein
MSTGSENEFDLEKLFLPAWAQTPASSKQYADFAGEQERPERRERRGPRPPRREGGGERRNDWQRGERRGPRRPEGPRAGEGKGPGERPPGGRRGEDRRGREPRREPPAPLPEVNVAFVPDEKGVDSLARQIRVTGRAYPLFEIAQMILQKPERHAATFSVRKNPEGKPIQPLFLCALDDTLWLSEDEAIGHVLRKHFATFYQTERTATEPPKGKYTFVAQCGMSGVVLGPPNYHDYQNQLRKLHAERFSRMPFEVFKSRVKIVRDEEVVKKWVDDQSWKTEYICLNLPEPLKLPNMEAVEKHFREVHKENIIKPVESHTMGGVAARNLRSPQLVRLVRTTWEEQRRFPLQIATVLSQQFASRGLQFFKVNRTVTHVSVARPRYLDLESTPVSEGVRKIVEFINSHAKSTRRQLIEALAPAPAPIPVAEAPAAPGETAQPAAEPPAPTPEQTAINADLHWLIHEGHVIEFANGILETAKKPAPKPPKPEPKPAEGAGVEGAVSAGAPEAQAAPAEATPQNGSAETNAAPPAPAQPLIEEGAPAAAGEHGSLIHPGEQSTSAPNDPAQGQNSSEQVSNTAEAAASTEPTQNSL